MGDSEYEADHRLRRGRRWFLAGTVLVAGALVAGGAWVNAQVPVALALQSAPANPAVPARALDSHAALVTDRLAAASGRSLESLAEEAAAPVSNPLESDAPVVAGAEAASEQYAETLAQLTEAEEAASEQLALTKEQAARAEADREAAEDDLVEEERAAATAIDAAIDAAIAAAQAQSAYVPYANTPIVGGGGGSVPEGRSTSVDEVLDLVRKHFPANQVGNAMAVSRCESGHRNSVSKPNGNGSRDFGVFQINDAGTMQAALRRIGVPFSDITEARSQALDPAINVRMARAIWDSRGWQPWVCAAKMKIVAGLYQRTPGPMAGRYDDYGRAL